MEIYGVALGGLEIVKVLFVCTENSCRSQVAEGFLNHFGIEGIKAVSAGTKPAERINSKAIEVMKELGIDISKQRPKLLTEEMIEDADRIITMGCGEGEVCPVFFKETIDWGIEDPAGKPIEKFREVRDIIRGRVERLVNEIKEKN